MTNHNDSLNDKSEELLTRVYNAIGECRKHFAPNSSVAGLLHSQRLYIAKAAVAAMGGVPVQPDAQRHGVEPLDSAKASPAQLGDALNIESPPASDCQSEISATSVWQPMETAPKDGTPIAVRCAIYTEDNNHRYKEQTMAWRPVWNKWLTDEDMARGYSDGWMPEGWLPIYITSPVEEANYWKSRCLFLESKTKPVSVSLEKCAIAASKWWDNRKHNEPVWFELSEVEQAAYRDQAKSVLKAAGVPYVD